MLAFHTDPFFAECRAYARIQDYQRQRPTLRKKASSKNERQRKLNVSKVAAVCYGFLAVKVADGDDYLLKQGIDLWSDFDPDDDYRLDAEGSPIRALVKEYIPVPSSPSIEKKLPVRYYKQMLRTIRTLNKTFRIVHRSIRLEAFHRNNGLIISFAFAWTLDPHCIMDVTVDYIAEAWRDADLVMFDDIAEEAGVADKVRALPQVTYISKLRSQKKV